MKVVFCTCFVKEPTKPFIESLENCLPAIEAAGWNHSYVQEVGNPYISAARAIALRKALDENPDCVVFLDYDLSWTPEAMVKLLNAKGDVVAGTYRFKRPEERYMGKIDVGSNGIQTRRDGCIKMEFVPAGFLKVTIGGIIALANKFPELLYGNPLSPHIDLFNHGAFEKTWYGEDYAFSRRWRETGEDLWCLADADIHHNTPNRCYEGNFHKHLLNYNKPKPILTNPLVSVVIPCYNQSEYLGEAIESVLAQTYENIEIIVVDDGSPDDVKAVTDKYPVLYMKKENGGVGSARNMGCDEAAGEWLVCLDADDVLRPTYIEKCLEVEGADIIATGQQNFGTEHRILRSPDEVSFIDLVNSNQLHCASMHRKAVWEVVNGWDEEFRTGFEDWDFWLRATQHGFEIKSVQEPLFMYRKHGTSMIDGAKGKFKELRERMLKKNNIEGNY